VFSLGSRDPRSTPSSPARPARANRHCSHALLTNLALTYSPDEAELYLIDFKEGVEFQWYATYRLPHARVVAIQSEREFGLSVLQTARRRPAGARREVPRRWG